MTFTSNLSAGRTLDRVGAEFSGEKFSSNMYEMVYDRAESLCKQFLILFFSIAIRAFFFFFLSKALQLESKNKL